MTGKEKMKSLLKATRSVLCFVSAALACILFASCSDEPGLNPDLGTLSDRDVWLSVDIRNHNAGGKMPSRASVPVDPDNHPDEAAEAAENYINLDDLSILLFDADNRLVRIFTPNEYNVTPTNAPDGDYRLLINTSAERLGIGSQTSGSLSFTMLMMANLNGTGDGDGAFQYTSLLNTVKDLSETRRGFGYTGFAGSGPWTPSIDGGRLIPMSGTVTATVDVATLKAGNTSTNPVELPTIYLQRAMAQVRLIDAIADESYEIIAVSMRGSTTRGAYLPLIGSGTDWAYNTEVVEYATSLDGWYNADLVLPSQKFKYNYTRNDVGSMKPGVDYDCYRLYIPEIECSAIGDSNGPALRITVHDNVADKDLNFTYRFPRTADFVRNHIYEVVVTGVNTTPIETELKITYGICPWEEPMVDIPEFS